MSQVTMYLLAVFGGIIPALVWLWFWLKEDYKKPEPSRRIVMTFLAGMLAAVVAIPYEYIFENIVHIYFAGSLSMLLLFWASVEEAVKLVAAYFSAFRTKFFDEPIDAPIYLITAAVGFAALENFFFLISSSAGGGTLLDGVILGNARFLGSVPLHILSSSVVGISIALSFYKSSVQRVIWTSVGLIIAIALHTGFNYLIIGNELVGPITVFSFVWILIIITLLFFERVKRLTKEHHEST